MSTVNLKEPLISENQPSQGPTSSFGVKRVVYLVLGALAASGLVFAASRTLPRQENGVSNASGLTLTSGGPGDASYLRGSPTVEIKSGPGNGSSGSIPQFNINELIDTKSESYVKPTNYVNGSSLNLTRSGSEEAPVKIINSINGSDLALTDSTSWGGFVNCVNATCLSILGFKVFQEVEVKEGGSSSSGLDLQYNVIDSSGAYITHMGLQVKGDGKAYLTNSGGGQVQLLEKNPNEYSIEKAEKVPTHEPSMSPTGNGFSKEPTGSPTIRVSFAPTAASSRKSPTPTQAPTSRPSSQYATPAPTSNSTGIVENSVWYIDWTTWFTETPYYIPEGVNLINIFVGEIIDNKDGTYTLGGFGNMNPSQMLEFVKQCNEKYIKVKVSIGGGGGSYDNTWELINDQNVEAVAKGMVDFCHAYHLAGVDFDDEDLNNPDLNKLVGTVMGHFKLLDPSLEVTLCTNAGYSTWSSKVETILNAIMGLVPGYCPLTGLYIMSYYNSLEEEQEFVKQWADLLKSDYFCALLATVVGIDDFDSRSYDPQEFASWALNMGYSIAHWACDPANISTCKNPAEVKKQLRENFLNRRKINEELKSRFKKN